MPEERWHVSQYANGAQVAHNVFTDWFSAYAHIRRKGLIMGSNVLARGSQCECRGRLS